MCWGESGKRTRRRAMGQAGRRRELRARGRSSHSSDVSVPPATYLPPSGNSYLIFFPTGNLSFSVLQSTWFGWCWISVPEGTPWPGLSQSVHSFPLPQWLQCSGTGTRPNWQRDSGSGFLLEVLRRKRIHKDFKPRVPGGNLATTRGTLAWEWGQVLISCWDPDLEHVTDWATESMILPITTSLFSPLNQFELVFCLLQCTEFCLTWKDFSKVPPVILPMATQWQEIYLWWLYLCLNLARSWYTGTWLNTILYFYKVILEINI